MMYYNYDYYDFFPFHTLFMFVFWGAIIWAIVYFVKDNKHATRHTLSSIDILKERYAKGEITKEEFTEMKKDLS